MLSLWGGFLIACNLALAASYLLAPADQPFDELKIYPHLAIISGLTYFVLGSSYWGQCYAFAIGFFLLALIIPLRLPWGPLEFGALWAVCLARIGSRFRHLASHTRN